MLKKKNLLCIALLWAGFLPGGIDIKVSSTPELPLANLIQNASFEETGLVPWQAIKGQEKAVALDPATAASGKNSLRVDSTVETSPGMFQRVKFPVRLPAGAPLYISVAGRKQGGNPEGKPAGVAFQVLHEDQTSRYQRVPEFPVEDYEWLNVEQVTELSKASSSGGTFYLCHYKQEGQQWFDDIRVLAGNVQLTVAVQSSETVRQVRLWSSKQGRIYDSGKLTGGSTGFQKTFELPGYATYYVEVEDSKGSRAGKVYPSEGETSPPATPELLPLFPLKRIVLTSGQPEILPFELPETGGKEVYLEFSARLQQRHLAGYTGALLIRINGQMLGAAELLKPKNNLTTANGKQTKVATNRGYLMYYSPAFFAISLENPYCPVSEPDHNPFHFKLDAGKFLHAGQNTLELSCTAKAPDGELLLLLENARIVLE